MFCITLFNCAEVMTEASPGETAVTSSSARHEHTGTMEEILPFHAPFIRNQTEEHLHFNNWPQSLGWVNKRAEVAVCGRCAGCSCCTCDDSLWPISGLQGFHPTVWHQLTWDLDRGDVRKKNRYYQQLLTMQKQKEHLEASRVELSLAAETQWQQTQGFQLKWSEASGSLEGTESLNVL